MTTPESEIGLSGLCWVIVEKSLVGFGGVEIMGSGLIGGMIGALS